MGSGGGPATGGLNGSTGGVVGGKGGAGTGPASGGAPVGGGRGGNGPGGQGAGYGGAGGAAGASADTFVHPGCLSTRADLTRMKTKVGAEAEPWMGSWKKLIANAHAQIGYTPNPQGSICAGAGCGSENYMTLAHDAAAAYQLALRYQIGGDERHAAAATQILDAWASKLTTFTGDSNAGLRVGLYGYQLAVAAELLRDYAPWDPSALKKLLLEVFYPIDADFLQRHNGACDGNYWANWDLAHMATVLAIGVFTDRRDIFNLGIDYFRQGVGAGAIDRAVYYVHPDGSGQWQESGRDQGHATLGPMLLAVAAEIAWNQGIDLYDYQGHRFLLGCEYVASYNLGNDVPFVAYAYQSGPQGSCKLGVQTMAATDSRGLVRVGWDILFNHYVNRRGLAAPFTAQYATLSRPEGGGGDYGPNSGGFDSLGFTTLTHTLDPVATGAVPDSVRVFIQGHQLALSWVGSAHATGYRVKRSLTGGGPYTTIATVATGRTSYLDAGLSPGQTYHYVVAALDANGEGPNSTEVVAIPDEHLFGSVIGTSGSFGSTGATKELVFDGALESFFDAPDSISWAGLDLGAGVAAVVTELAYAPRRGFGSRMVGGKLQGSSTPDFTSDVTDLFTITAAPSDGVLTRHAVTASTAYRYLRYVSPSGGNGNVAEVAFFGKGTGLAPPAVPTALTAVLAPTTTDAHATAVQWIAVAGAESYRVKRASGKGASYVIVGDTSAPRFADGGLAATTSYAYVVSALNKLGESADSVVATVTTGP
jgi:hypothetical protein